MSSLLMQASKSDPQSMFLVALTMERLNCILDDSVEHIVTFLIETGGVKVCGVLLNCVSGQLHSLIKSIYGLKLLSNMIKNFSTLQLHIGRDMIMEGQDIIFTFQILYFSVGRIICQA